jgi:hypothetical protein
MSTTCMASGEPNNNASWYSNSNVTPPQGGIYGAAAGSAGMGGMLGGTFGGVVGGAGMIGSPGQMGGVTGPSTPWYQQVQPVMPLGPAPQLAPFIVSPPVFQTALASEMEALKQRMAELEAQLAELLPKKELLTGAPVDGVGRVVEL